MKRKTHEEFINELKNINSSIVIKGKYVNSSTKIEVECLKCKNVWKTVPNSLVQGHGCPVCANNIRKTTEDFIIQLKTINPYIEVIGEYETAHTPLTVKCLICNSEWNAKPSRLLAGTQCMNCVKPHTSFMEQFILKAFQYVLGNNAVEERNVSAIGLELDVYLPAYKYAIEPGTWLYHKRKVDNQDVLKREKCKEAGIRLITVYDSYPNESAPPFENDCYVYSGFLNEQGYKRIIDLVKKLFLDIEIFDYDTNWNELANQAYKASHYNAHESFIMKLADINPDIEILENYKGNNIPILVRNKKCSHSSWKTRPCTLLKGIGCPECGKITSAEKRTRSNKEFASELSCINPFIELIGEYIKVTERIDVRCKICGREWFPLAYSLLSGKGCPHCSAIEAAKKRSNGLAVKTTEQFIDELKSINSNIIIHGKYINNKTKILAECSVCNHKWEVVPASLLNGHGCPKCARKRKTLNNLY